jgi:glucose dehydrogenase
MTPYPNIVFAPDLTKPGAPMKWSHRPYPAPASQGVACCGVVNRGATYSDGKLFFNTLDDNTIRLDAETGKVLWKTKLGDISTSETITMASLVEKGKVLVGDSGGELGVHGWLTALDVATGKILWRAYATGPDKDVLIGPGFHSFYPTGNGADLGVTSWPADAWQTGGGTMWGWIAYDPDLNLVFYGTGNPGSWNQEQRPGDNKWTTTLFARDPDTGAAKWGPMAGYFAAQAPKSLTIELVQPWRDGKDLRMAFYTSIGVRRGDNALLQRLDDSLERNQAAISAILAEYHVPVLPDSFAPH